ncbi:hypothetical protein AB0B28_05185 [Glycomyces sp. NPDC046736]|uniref:WXG100 family type VII secretion target n=1 Tax=Glycomyces sp. NPDC046736 TaxID=3155615 RepID=UPI0033CCC5ED
MPTYEQVMSGEPTEFMGYAMEVTAAAGDLAAHQTDYGTKVTELNAHWQDAANEAFNAEVGTVNAHITQVIGEINAAATTLQAAGSEMFSVRAGMQLTEAFLKGKGFDVLPAPLVAVSAAQHALIAQLGPLGGFLEAALQAEAAAGTAQLQSALGLLNAADAAAGAVLNAVAEALQPLEDKRGGATSPQLTGDSVETPEEEEDAAEEEQEEEEEEEKTPEEEAQEEAEQRQEQNPTGEDMQQPTMPQDPSGLGDIGQPDLPEYDNPWDSSELDADDLTGGLASGGGLGTGGVGGGVGGLGSGGLTSGAGVGPQGGMGGATLAAPTAPAAAGAGRPGGAGGMMGGAGGGARGAGGSDSETERESKLLEDPDEDVWGIGSDDDPYA